MTHGAEVLHLVQRKGAQLYEHGVGAEYFRAADVPIRHGVVIRPHGRGGWLCLETDDEARTDAIAARLWARGYFRSQGPGGGPGSPKAA